MIDVARGGQSAGTYSTTPNGLYRWRSRNLDLNIYNATEDSSVAAELQKSINTWNAVTTSGGSDMIDFTITSDYTCANKVVYYSMASGVLGRMIPTTSGGYMSSFVIRLNTYYTWATSAQSGKVDIQSVLTHEIGHALGVSHCHNASESTCGTSQCPYNVMNPTLSLGQARRTLMSYDISTYRALYN